jgi:hypothetical protein
LSFILRFVFKELKVIFKAIRRLLALGFGGGGVVAGKLLMSSDWDEQPDVCVIFLVLQPSVF